MPNVSDIVRFSSACSDAAEFCRNRGITGKVVSKTGEILEIDAGFDYMIYAPVSGIEVVASRFEIPIPVDFEELL